MATTIEVVDGAAFHEGIASVRSDATDDKYIICCHVDGDPNRVQTVQVGQSTSEIAGLLDESQVMYALGCYETKFDMSTTVKFVYFRWIGEKVPLGKKGKYGVVKGEAESMFSPYHLFVESSNPEDFADDLILQQDSQPEQVETLSYDSHSKRNIER